MSTFHPLMLLAATMSDLSDIFKAYDVRGTVPEQFDDEKVLRDRRRFRRIRQNASDPYRPGYASFR